MSEKKRGERPLYPAEFRERAVRMGLDHQGDYPSQWKVIGSISAKLSINHETLRVWVRRAEILKGGLGFLCAGTRPATAEIVAFIDDHRHHYISRSRR